MQGINNYAGNFNCNEESYNLQLSLKAVLLLKCVFPASLRVFENRVLRRIFGPKRDGVTGV